MTESEFDSLIVYTLRIELIIGKVLLYRIDSESKKHLMSRLKTNSDGDEQKKNMDE